MFYLGIGSEGFGRFFYKENRRFCYYARGSLYETFTWMEKAHHRGLIGGDDYDELRKELGILIKMLNRYTASLGRTSTSLKAAPPPMTDAGGTASTAPRIHPTRVPVAP